MKISNFLVVLIAICAILMPAGLFLSRSQANQQELIVNEVPQEPLSFSVGDVVQFKADTEMHAVITRTNAGNPEGAYECKWISYDGEMQKERVHESEIEAVE